jgi:phosphomevalonate kinase
MPLFYILISGKRCVGKDTVASMLHREIPDSFVMGFADILKYQYAKRIAPDQVEECYERLLNDYEFKQKHRMGLIELSQEEKRRYGNDIWVRRLLNYVREVYGSTEKFVTVIIADTRFRYELEHPAFVRDNSLKIRVECPDNLREQRGWTFDSRYDCDESETDLSLTNSAFDRIVVNDGTLDDLERKCVEILSHLKFLKSGDDLD